MLHRVIITAVLLMFVMLVAHRIRRYATFELARQSMPARMEDGEERRLFQSPQGKYLLADIHANGSLLPSERYPRFRAVHDYKPAPGDRLCPITRTKANSQCTWIVDGQTYEFCCPPCIAEFIRTAKEQPEHILPPDEYVATGR